MIKWLANKLFPNRKIVIGKKYVYDNDVGAFYPLIYIPKKMNNTHVLCDCYSIKYGPQISHESEWKISSFKLSFVPYDDGSEPVLD